MQTLAKRRAGKGRTSPTQSGEGLFIGNRNGYGFVRIEGRENDIFVPAKRTRDAFDGDTVKIRFTKKGDRCEGEVLSVRAERRSVVGVVVKDEEWGIYLLPDCPRIPPLELNPKDRCKVGDKIEVSLPRYGEETRLLQSFGPASLRASNDKAVLSELSIETEFSEDTLKEAERMAAIPPTPDGRVDLRRDTVFTIDSEGAKDLDDAVSLKVLKDGYVLGVHIADVSSYVKPYSALDRTAHSRGTSLYFADRVVPMLPPSLSNGACSLNEGQNKWTVSALITLTKDGAIRGTEIVRSIIRSKKRGVYAEINDLFERGEDSPFFEKYKTVRPTLLRMRTLCRRLQRAEEARGVPSFETPEAIISLSPEGAPTSIKRAERGESEKMIETMMLLANRAVATLLTEKGIPCVYREHGEPPPEKVNALVSFLKANKLPVPPLGKGGKLTLPLLASIIKAAMERNALSAVSTMVIRSMAKATYTERPLPHFGLSIPLYCHFTSPIRRLADLVTHRIIGACLLGDAPPEKYRAAAKRAADAATATELRALEAERRIEALFKAEYLSYHIGEVFEGQISGVTAFGVYVELENTCEGLLPLSLLPEGFVYNEDSKTLQKGELTLTLGTPVTVKVRDADLSSGHVTFSPIE